MDGYKDMYFELFNKITDVIEEMKNVQCEAEKRFVEIDDGKVVRLVDDGE